MIGDSVGPGLWVKLGLDPSGLSQGVDVAKEKLDGLKDSTDDVDRSTTNLWNDLKIYGAEATLVWGVTTALADKLGTEANQLRDLSFITGINTTQLQRYQYAARLAGEDSQTLAVFLQNLTRAMGDAQDETGPAYKAFMGVGIDPRGRMPDEVFKELAVALGKIEDPAKKAAAAQNILGRGWQNDLPILETYLEKQGEINSHTGLSPEELKQLEKSKTNLANFYADLNTGAAKLLLTLIELTKYLDPTRGIDKNIGWVEDRTINTGSKGAWDMTGASPMTINVYNSKGTPAETEAAVRQAARDLGRLVK